MKPAEVERIAKRFDALCKRGLCAGISRGKGANQQFCVEAAIDQAYKGDNADPSKPADDPICVDHHLRDFKIAINDDSWSSPQARAKGMRDVGIAQLGTSSISFDFAEFDTRLIERLVEKAIELIYADGGAAEVREHLELIRNIECENTSQPGQLVDIVREVVPTKDAALNLVTSAAAEVLIEMDTPGGKWLVAQRRKQKRR